MVALFQIYVIETKTYSKPEKGESTIDFDGEKLTIQAIGEQTSNSNFVVQQQLTNLQFDRLSKLFSMMRNFLLRLWRESIRQKLF